MSPAHWLSSGHGNDAGFEDLQTDVMRFMAILAFCLMAVFALVQSIPLASEPPPAAAAITPQAAAQPTPAAQISVVVPEPPPPAQPVKPSAAVEVPAGSASQPSATLHASTVVAAPEWVPAPTATPTPVAEQAVKPQGFTLRFSSDAALRRLVLRGKVGLYAFGDGQSWRLAPALTAANFQATKAPSEYNAMATQTVPTGVASALYEQAGLAPASVTWGVTLPPPTRYAIARLVREYDSGALIIGADGRVRREAQ